MHTFIFDETVRSTEACPQQYSSSSREVAFPSLLGASAYYQGNHTLIVVEAAF